MARGRWWLLRRFWVARKGDITSRTRGAAHLAHVAAKAAQPCTTWPAQVDRPKCRYMNICRRFTVRFEGLSLQFCRGYLLRHRAALLILMVRFRRWITIAMHEQ